MGPKILPKDSPLVNHINDNSKTDRYLEKKEETGKNQRRGIYRKD
jgi:hypothetical protein